jgi:hypothetical protein
MAVLQSEVKDLKAKHAYFEIVAARLEALELRNNHSIQITAEKSLGDQMVDVMPQVNNNDFKNSLILFRHSSFKAFLQVQARNPRHAR